MKANRKETLKRGLLVLTVLLIAFGLYFPTNYYIEGPGSAETLASKVEVDGKTDTNAGSFMLTTVSVRQASPFTALAAKFSDFEELVSKQDLMGGSTDEEYDRIQNYYMESSENAAIKVAMDLAEVPYELDYQGVYVLALSEQSNFKKYLSVGDTISKADGKSFKSSEEFREYIQSRKVGDEVTLTYQHDGETKEATGKLYALETDGKAGIGITLTDHTEISSERKVEINPGNIGGPSAGLMFTLETYSLLSGKDIRKGYEIAGTGEIYVDGTVGRIGGIDKKIVAASKAGAEIFFAPEDEITDEMKEAYPDILTNYQEAVNAAKKIDTAMKIVPVKTAQDALDYLAKLKAK